MSRAEETLATRQHAGLPVKGQRRRFHVATIVRYRRWAGPVYFNVIRPFHHLVVRGMLRHAARG
ncbi:DUF2867 domain-containing protein [Myxococcaceae bacterium GXIMD 01537]